MSEAPEKIWAEQTGYFKQGREYFNGGKWSDDQNSGMTPYIRADLVEADVKRAIEDHASAIKNLWAMCEQVEDACRQHLNSGMPLTEHEIGFWRGQKMLAKSISRSMELPNSDPKALAAMEGKP